MSVDGMEFFVKTRKLQTQQPSVLKKTHSFI